MGAPIAPRHAVRATGQPPATVLRSQLPMMAAEDEEKKEGGTMEQVKEAGVAGIISYIFWEWAFWGVSVPVCIFGYREVTGHWPDFSDQEDLAKLGVAGIISYIFWEWAFWGVSVPVCIFGYRE